MELLARWFTADRCVEARNLDYPVVMHVVVSADYKP